MHVNFRSFSVADAIDFVAYSAITCNGSSLIAEIARRVTTDPYFYQEQLIECKDNMYDFLCHVNREIMPGIGIGSCTNNRFTYSQGSSDSNWGRDRGRLLNLCKEFHDDKNTVTRQNLLIQKTQDLFSRLVNSKINGKSEFHGVGPMSANQFLQLASLLGLIPLYCFTYANLHSVKLGPSKAIMRGLKNPNMSLKEIQQCFENVFDELRDVWGNLVTKAVLENVLCEISRCYDRTAKGMKRRNGIDQLPLSIICESSSETFRESGARDIFFYNDMKGNMQNMFWVTSGSSGGTTLRPCLLMRDSNTWEKGNDSIHNLTNWCQNKGDKRMVQWSNHGSAMTLETSLIVSKDLKRIIGKRK